MTTLPTSGDTIAAISSAAGPGGRMLLRLSGPRAFEIARRLVPDLPPASEDSAPRVRTATFMLAEGARLPCTVSLYCAPKTFTREDIAEIALVGSPPLAEAALEATFSAGARAATHGEFTLRAFLNGRIDLASAEAVAEVIAADDPSAARAALRTVQGRLSSTLRDVEAHLTGVCARLEGAIDFADQDIDVISTADILRDLADARTRVVTLRSDCRQSRPTNALPCIALLGPPNAGKTSLFNALTGDTKAIASPEAGTTRDLLRSRMPLSATGGFRAATGGFRAATDGLPAATGGLLAGRDVELWDSPGLTHDGTPLSHRMTGRTLDHSTTADLGLFVADITDTGTAVRWLTSMPRDLPTIGVLNKADLAGERLRRDAAARLDLPTVVIVSALTGLGLDDLRRAIVQALERSAGAVGGGTVGRLLVSARQAEQLEAAELALDRAIQGLETRGTTLLELAAEDVRSALSAIGDLTGRNVTDAVLAQIFERFCIGK